MRRSQLLLIILHVTAFVSLCLFGIITAKNRLLIHQIRDQHSCYNPVTSTPGVAFSTGVATAGVEVAAVIGRFLAKMACLLAEMMFCKVANFLLHLSQLHSRTDKSGYSTALQVVTRFLKPP